MTDHVVELRSGQLRKRPRSMTFIYEGQVRPTAAVAPPGAAP